MPKWMADLQLQAQSVKSFVVNTATQTWSFGKYAYRTVELPARTLDLMMDAGEGFTRIAYPSNVFALIRAPKVRSVLKHSAVSVSYGLIALFYDMAIRKTVQTYASESVAETTIPLMDALTLYLLCRQAMGAMVDKVVFNSTLSKAALQEANPDFRALKGCACSSAEMVPGLLMSPFYYVGDTLAIGMLSAYLPGGAYLLPPLMMLREGQALLEYQLSARGYCEKHLLEVMNKNNAYAFGYGASYVVTSWTVGYVLSLVTDRRNPLVMKAFDSLLYQYFIFMAYQMDRPLPGKKDGIDCFRYSRLVTQTMVKEVAAWLERQVMNPQASDAWTRMQAHVAQFPPFKLVVRWLVPDKLKSVDAYIQSPAGQLYLDFFGDGLQGTIQWVLALREQTLVVRIHSVSGYLPQFIISDSTAKLLSLLLNEKMEVLLTSANDFLEKVGRSAPAKVTIIDSKKIKEGALPPVPPVVVLNDYDPTRGRENTVEAKLRRRQLGGAQSLGLFAGLNAKPELTSSDPELTIRRKKQND